MRIVCVYIKIIIVVDITIILIVIITFSISFLLLLLPLVMVVSLFYHLHYIPVQEKLAADLGMSPEAALEVGSFARTTEYMKHPVFNRYFYFICSGSMI